MQCLVTNARRVIDMTISALPVPEVGEGHSQFAAQIMKQANSVPISEKIWPQKPESKDLGVIEYHR